MQGIFAMAEQCKNRLIGWDEKVVWQMVACVKVIDCEKLLVVFRGQDGKGGGDASLNAAFMYSVII